MATVRFAVSPGTMFVSVTRDPAVLLSLLTVSVADPKVLPGFVVVAARRAGVGASPGHAGIIAAVDRVVGVAGVLALSDDLTPARPRSDRVAS